MIVERDGAVSVIRLNRPAAMNALNRDLLEKLVDALRDTRSTPVRVLEAEGRAFCAGEDLKETLAPETGKPEELHAAFEQLQEVTRLLTMNGVVIAAVDGPAVGGGAELALATDLIVLGPQARFRFPEVVLGHAPTGGITGRLAAYVGLARAKLLLLTGNWLDAHEALELGIGAELVPQPAERARQLAHTLADLPQRSLLSTKRGIELAVQPNQEATLQAEVGAASYCFDADEATVSVDEFRKGLRR